jgi:hypothetical protein
MSSVEEIYNRWTAARAPPPETYWYIQLLLINIDDDIEEVCGSSNDLSLDPCRTYSKMRDVLSVGELGKFHGSSTGRKGHAAPVEVGAEAGVQRRTLIA